jgi:4'-phosphopantetheinyl transferase EntD
VIERLVPDSVVVVSTREDLVDDDLFAEEIRSLGQAVDKRRREFTTGRVCAHRALRRLGLEAVAIDTGPHGEPLWPTGVVGSITHCDGYRACAVARCEGVRAIGIDAEPDEPLPDGVFEHVAFGREPALVADRAAGPCMDRLLFSAKEAVYKAWFPLTGRWLGFDDVELAIDAGGGTFRAVLLVPGPVVDGARLTELRGRWCAENGVVATAVVVPATGRSPGQGPSCDGRTGADLP